MEPIHQEPIDLGNLRRVYFDTSAWNYLSRHADRAKLVREIKQSGSIVLASVISVGEVLRTDNAEFRRLMCSTIRELHGAGILLERPEDIAIAVAVAFRRGEKNMLLPRTGPGEKLYSYVHDPTSPPSAEIRAWLENMDGNVSRFIDAMKPPKPDTKTRYCSAEVFDREDFLQTLCNLPFAKESNISIYEMRELCQASDIWKGLGATIGYIIELSTTHAPTWHHGRKRTGGPDIRQLAYLGVADIFVTKDRNQLEAARRVAECLKYPRCVVSIEEFTNGIPSSAAIPDRIQRATKKKCQVCGCRLPTRAGTHMPALQ
jgi:hypothetical protein